ncbi:hypothetical protein LIER_37053 [Lithospermum erythrorhizon]|uniref:Uncharacterized protein n=1 Tax=Lithospermum erythrorhizon TaxID=34254 RepID=A0AAV3PEI9_LITER
MVTMGKHPQQAMKMVEFTIVDMSEGAYNGIIGRPTLSQFGAVVSLIHIKMQFPTRYGTGEIQGSQKKTRGCYVPKESPKRGRPHEEIWTLTSGIWPKYSRLVRCGGTAQGDAHSGQGVSRYLRMGTEGYDRVDPEVAVHQLYVDPRYNLVNQKKRTFSKEKGEAIARRWISCWGIYHSKVVVPNLASHCGASAKAKWNRADVHGLHQHK